MCIICHSVAGAIKDSCVWRTDCGCVYNTQTKDDDTRIPYMCRETYRHKIQRLTQTVWHAEITAVW